jgi:hypothetical protein
VGGTGNCVNIVTLHQGGSNAGYQNYSYTYGTPGTGREFGASFVMIYFKFAMPYRNILET